MGHEFVVARHQFPDLGQRVYLANCSLGPRSIALEQSQTEMLGDMAGSSLAWAAFEAKIDEVRRAAAQIIGTEAEHIALMPNATLGAYQVAATRNWKWRPEILCSTGEFPSLGQVWLAQAERGARVRWADPERIVEAITPATQIVSTPLVAYQDARRADLRSVGQAARAAGAMLFVDAYQAAGVEEISVTELNCDFLVFGTMKYLLGLPGLAFLYVRDPERMPEPELTGWFGRTECGRFTMSALAYPSSARKLEIGTPAIPAVYAAVAGLGLIAKVNPRRIREHIVKLTCYAENALKGIGERISSPGIEQRGAHICLATAEPERLSQWLAARNIIVSPRGSVIRIAFHFFNTRDDVHQLLDALRDFRLADSQAMHETKVLVRS